MPRHTFNNFKSKDKTNSKGTAPFRESGKIAVNHNASGFDIRDLSFQLSLLKTNITIWPLQGCLLGISGSKSNLINKRLSCSQLLHRIQKPGLVIRVLSGTTKISQLLPGMSPKCA